jgi:hypothetical protein
VALIAVSMVWAPVYGGCGEAEKAYKIASSALSERSQKKSFKTGFEIFKDLI